MAIAMILREFAGGTTMHGVPKAIRARSSPARVFWAIVCLSATVMFTAQFVQLLTKYYSYPKKVTLEIVPATVRFPAISLCNMRNLDVMVLNTLNHIFKNVTDPRDWILGVSNNTFINEYMRTVAKYYPMFVKNDSDWKVFQTVLTRTLIASNIDKRLVAQAGVPFKEFIVTCRFGGAECNQTEFTPFFDPYYYSCFTYTAAEPTEKGSILAEGLENGWSTTVLTGTGMLDQNDDLRMIPGTHERFSPMASSEGVSVVCQHL